MRNRIAIGASLTIALLVGGVIAAEPIKSGPQPGDSCGVFEPLHVTGPGAGSKSCLV